MQVAASSGLSTALSPVPGQCLGRSRNVFSEHVNYSPGRGLGLPLQAIGSDEGRVPVGHHVLTKWTVGYTNRWTG